MSTTQLRLVKFLPEQVSNKMHNVTDEENQRATMYRRNII